MICGLTFLCFLAHCAVTVQSLWGNECQNIEHLLRRGIVLHLCSIILPGIASCVQFAAFQLSRLLLCHWGTCTVAHQMQSLCGSSFTRRQLSTVRIAGSVLGRLLKLRYILLTGAVGGGVTVHQVTTLCFKKISLWSGSQNLLAFPTLSSEFGRYAFSYHTPSVWNKLPLSIQSLNSFNSLKSRLETRLFAHH